MLFNDNFIESIANDPISSIIQVIDIVFSKFDDTLHDWTPEEHDALLEGFPLVCSIIDNFELSMPIDINRPLLTGTLADDAKAMRTFLNSIQEEFKKKHSQMRFDTTKNRFDALLNQSFSYEFSQGDLDRVQQLINELREEINTSNLFEQKHKSRLLKRLEKLQAELHKKMSDIDVFWGLVGDAGVAIGKFGKDAKPFVDRIREITDIVWRTQSRAEELPSGTPTPLLENFDS
jgi:hypothetical protein